MTDNSSIELERTFLARFIPEEIKQLSPITLEDVYFPEDLTLHPHLRVRRKGDRYEITKKVPVTDGDASAHVETTIPLDKAEYESLQGASRRRVIKHRYKVALDGFVAEVDVFAGELAGLVLIDFEFGSEDDMRQFVVPACCLTEVTQEGFLAGGLLSGRSYRDIEPELSRLGYVRIS